MGWGSCKVAIDTAIDITMCEQTHSTYTKPLSSRVVAARCEAMSRKQVVHEHRLYTDAIDLLRFTKTSNSFALETQKAKNLTELVTSGGNW